jgi:GH3 auxin-responsive promoter.
VNDWSALASLCPKYSQQTLEERQTAWLLACLKRNSKSNFGRRHGFDSIDGVANYQRRVPLSDYEMVREAIQCITDGASDILFCECPVAFERTGGNSGGAKLIPYTAESLLDFRCALLRWLKDTIVTYRLQYGHAYWALSPATRDKKFTPAGIPIGLPDGAYFGPEGGALFARTSAVPPTLINETNVESWQLETLYWLLRCPDLVLVSIWSPSFFSSLLDALPRHSATLLVRLPHDDPAAAKRLRKWLNNGDTRELWPHLRLVSCWADASSRPYFDDLRQRLPHAAFQPKGLLSTEAVVTIPDSANRPLLAADSGFYEFFSDDGAAHPAWMLHANERYEVLLTTAGGLYRYRTGDCVECSGHVGEHPVLHFVGRNERSSDLVGEKLTDAFVADCLTGIPGFRLLQAYPKSVGYVLVHDGRYTVDLLKIERRLSRNPQYAYARRMAQLQPLSERIVPDALTRYTTYAVQIGQRLGDVKLPSLCFNTDWLD